MSMAVSSGDECQVYSSIGERLYLRQEKADVYFVFESAERIPAHKLLLSSASDVFDTMFHGSLKEEGDIKIVDVTAEAFKEFLRFFYFSKIELNIENVADMMYLGKKYDVEKCLEHCSKLLTAVITAENAMNILSLAILYDHKEMLDLCETEIRLKSTEILQSKSFDEFERQVLSHILQMDGLSCSATVIFKACMSWVKAASKQDVLSRDIVTTHLGELFYAIPFGSMSWNEFVDLLPSYGNLFSAEEYNEILQVISGQPTEPRLFKKCRISLLSRNCKKLLVCDRRNADLPAFRHKPDVIITKFSSNSPLLLVYFQCHVSFDRSDRKSIENCVKIHEFNSEETGTVFSYDINATGGTICLPTPMLIKPEVIYEIILSVPNADFYNFRQLRSTVNIYNEITVKFYDDPESHSFDDASDDGIIQELGFTLLKNTGLFVQ